jgi:hypothetical protein
MPGPMLCKARTRAEVAKSQALSHATTAREEFDAFWLLVMAAPAVACVVALCALCGVLLCRKATQLVSIGRASSEDALDAATACFLLQLRVRVLAGREQSNARTAKQLAS